MVHYVPINRSLSVFHRQILIGVVDDCRSIRDKFCDLPLPFFETNSGTDLDSSVSQLEYRAAGHRILNEG